MQLSSALIDSDFSSETNANIDGEEIIKFEDAFSAEESRDWSFADPSR